MRSPVGSPPPFIPTAGSSPRPEIPLTGQATLKRNRSVDSDTSSSGKASSFKRRRNSADDVQALVARQGSGSPSHSPKAKHVVPGGNTINCDASDVESPQPASPASSSVESSSSQRLLISESGNLVFLVERGSTSEPLAESLFEFHKEAMERSTTYQTLIHSAEQFGKIAIDMSDADMGGQTAQTTWSDEGSFHHIEIFHKGIEKAVEARPPDERSKGMEAMGIHWLVNELNNAAMKAEFDELNQAARNGDFADKTLQSDTDRQLARHDNDGPAVHYAREVERVESSYREKLDSIHQEIHASYGRQMRELSPLESFEEYYQAQVDQGHSQGYRSYYDRLVGNSSA